jgi:hypothetical protein
MGLVLLTLPPPEPSSCTVREYRNGSTVMVISGEEKEPVLLMAVMIM